MATSPAVAPGQTGRQETLSEWAGPYVTSMLGKAEALTEQPYQVYGGPLTAGASNLQQKYFEGLEKIGFPGQLGQSFTSTGAPTIPTASTTGAAQGITSPTGIAGQYMNPYLQNVLQPQLEEIRRQAQIQQMQNASRMAKAGAFGGGRQAILDAELQRNLMTQMDKTIGQGYSTAYDRAMDQFNREQAQAMGLAGLLEKGGASQRAIEAEGIAADVAEFEKQRDYPYKQLQFQQSMLQGLPIQSIAASYQQPSALTNTMNLMGGLMQMYKDMFSDAPKTNAPKAP